MGASVANIAEAIKEGFGIVMQLPEVIKAVQEVYSMFEGATEFSDRHRSLELLVINGSNEKLTWEEPYFDSGTTFEGPKPMNIAPGEMSLYKVANRQGSFATGVSGGAKWLIEGTDRSLIIGFTNPHMGGYKYELGIRSKNESAEWGYDNSDNDDAKQHTQSGYYISVWMEKGVESPYKRYVYCIANS
ncbi:MAG: hypothetical protein QNJ74_16460 [Trichodesmium sp. MO_231.B1]|nr:hypothetical protein [Trichodesmium sp. MO_231.B1]